LEHIKPYVSKLSNSWNTLNPMSPSYQIVGTH